MDAGRDRSFTVLDWIGVVVSVAAISWIAQWPFITGPRLQKMLKDFGGALPSVTQAAFSRSLVLTLALLPAALVLAGVLARGSLAVRRSLVVAGFVVALSGAAFLYLAHVLPIYSVASSIK